MTHLVGIQLAVIERAVAKIHDIMAQWPRAQRRKLSAREAEVREIAREIAAANRDDITDPWTELLFEWAASPAKTHAMGPGSLSTRPAGPDQRIYPDEFLIHRLGMPKAKIELGDRRRVAAMLRKAGWRKRQDGPQVYGPRLVYWIPPRKWDDEPGKAPDTGTPPAA